MEQNQRKYYKSKSLLWYSISRFFTRLIPFGAVIYIYGLYTTNTDTKIQVTGMTMLVFAFLFFFFYTDIKEWASAYSNSKWKYAEKEARVLYICVALQLFIVWARGGIGQLEVLLWVVMGTQALGLYPSILYEQYRTKYAMIVKKEEEL